MTFGSSWWSSRGETTEEGIVLHAGGLPLSFFEAPLEPAFDAYHWIMLISAVSWIIVCLLLLL